MCVLLGGQARDKCDALQAVVYMPTVKSKVDFMKKSNIFARKK
jgi:hypothetical protein